MRSSPLWKHRMPSWMISCWHLGIFTCTCANTDTISYITLPICTVRDIHSVSENIIFPKHRKVHDLNLYREENTSEPLILIRKLLPIFQNGLILHYQMASLHKHYQEKCCENINTILLTSGENDFTLKQIPVP